MIKALRKRHLQVWTLWALVLPAGIIAAWLSVPQPVHNDLLQPADNNPLPLIVRTAEKTDYSVHLRSNADRTQWQLEWINKNVLTHPTATIYKIAAGSQDIRTAELIGRIEARGSYIFPLRDSSVTSLNLMLYDFIHEQIIDTIKIN
jgi:hypothetical protein